MSQPSQDNQGGHQGQYPGQAPGPPGTIVNLMSQQQFSQAQQHSPPSGAPTPVNPYYQQQFPLMIGNVQPPVPPQQTPPPGNNQWLPPSAQSSPSPSGRGPSRGRGAGRGRDTHAAFGGQQPLPQNTPLYPSPPTFLPQPPLSPSYHQHIQTFSSSSPPRSGYPQSIHPSVGYPVPVPQFPIPAPLYRAPSPAASTSDPAAPSFRNPGLILPELHSPFLPELVETQVVVKLTSHLHPHIFLHLHLHLRRQPLRLLHQPVQNVLALRDYIHVLHNTFLGLLRLLLNHHLLEAHRAHLGKAACNPLLNLFLLSFRNLISREPVL
ncbi:hypothetical protein Dda_2483 [Drechslerella dactyloides]|uniref:Uncharacterized protein n=1 Tax=Drechslerella dactyloides TaxID=74499 RepID=A0AAD6NKT1_DREDA|nr:hypothetical protein Dda_2483 [Drechslerella dactyloides]